MLITDKETRHKLDLLGKPGLGSGSVTKDTSCRAAI